MKPMRWSLKLGTFAGIAVYLHWTFSLLIGWIFVANLSTGNTLIQALSAVSFILALFACVVLHEFGHALTARRYGVRTENITLLPIGGVARLDRIPEKPMAEFWVAVAGPAVNVAIAAIIFLALLGLNRVNELLQIDRIQSRFLTRLLWVNLLLVTFNLLPAFPMDGGRVLRALLSTRLGRPRATMIASKVGQFMAILFVIFGFFSNPFLILIGGFVYLGAQAELVQVRVQAALEGLLVRDAMMTQFRTLTREDSLSRAIDELLAGSQHDFPVMQNGEVVGMLRRKDLIKGISLEKNSRSVDKAMFVGCQPIKETDSLMPILERMRTDDCSTLPVFSDGNLTGLLTLENVKELLMIKSARPGNGSEPHGLQLRSTEHRDAA